RVAALVLAALLTGSSPVAAGPLPDEFLGKFRGSVTGGVGEVSGDFDMMSAAKRNGFTMSWPQNSGTGFEAAKDRENVFRAPSEGKLIEGAPAFWARLADGKLLVYAMRIDSQGGYDIYTFVYTPVENGLDLLIYHLRSGSEPLESRARLARHDR
ncbi:MAG: hypothetical protein IMF08_07710, partial [Proteobacteria bacterium]|nr:hypothetical protein [Pseudomonadota bacterium]